MTIRKLLLATTLVTPALLVFAAPAQAQVQGIASVDQMRAIISSKAFTTANQQIDTTYKTTFDQIETRQTALDKEVKPYRDAIDTNHDGEISQAELDAAQASKNPAVDKIEAAQQNAQRDLSRLQQPIVLAQAFATEQILQQYEGAQLRVVNARKIGMILTPGAILYKPDGADITTAVTAELDKAVPTVPITPPANWQPQQRTIAFLQQYSQLVEQVRAQQAQQQAQRPAAPAAAQPARPGQPAPAPTR